MDPPRGGVSSSYSSLEQIWINEVLYLHSLWHHGPPQNPNPNSNSSSNNNNNIPPCSSIVFKKESKKRKKTRKPRNRGNKDEKSELEPVSEVEWPCEPIPEHQKEIGWPDPPGPSTTRSVSFEEQAKFNAVQLQKLAMKSSKDFFSKKFGLDSKDDEDFEEEEEDFMDDDDEVEESEEFKFFVKIFTEHNELRSYYEKNYESGEFSCLVCGVIGKKKAKRFTNCVSLVQHSTSISKTKQKRAHRAFGGVVCRVLGWEMNRLPSIVLSATGPLGRLLAQTDSQVGIAEIGKKIVDSVNADIAGCDQRGEVNDNSVGVDGNSADCEVGRNETDANDQEKLLDEEILDTMGPNNGEPMDCNVNGDIVGDDQNDVVVNSMGGVNGQSADCEVGASKNDANDQEKALDEEIVDTTEAITGEQVSREDGAERQAGQEVVREDGAGLQE